MRNYTTGKGVVTTRKWAGTFLRSVTSLANFLQGMLQSDKEIKP